MNPSPLLLLLAILSLAGCNFPKEGTAGPPIEPLAYHFTLTLTSRIPEPYPVLAGDSQSYGRFPVNAWARQALEKRLAARSAGGDAPQVAVAVNLQKLTTSYNEIGQGPTLHAPLYNGIGPRLLAGNQFEEGDGLALPSKIHKTGVLRGALSLKRDGRTLVHLPLQEQVEIDIYWEDIDSWSFRFNDVIRALVDQLVQDVDDALLDRFAPGAGPR